MKEVILIRFGEIFLKGRNYSYFENTLFKNVERRLKKFNLKLERISGRFLVSDFQAEDKDDIIEAIQKYEPRAIIRAIEFENETTAAADGILKPKITLEINEDA